MVPFRSFHYYHPEQNGSCSIKCVLPCLTESGYDDLEIAGGNTASQEYLRVITNEVSQEEKERVFKALIDYCSRDTKGMVDILHALSRLIN
jgi:hypothetical protein